MTSIRDWIIPNPFAFERLQQAQSALSHSVSGLGHQISALGSSVCHSVASGANRTGVAALATLHSCRETAVHQYGRLKYATEQAGTTTAALVVGQFLHQGICVGIPTLMREAVAFHLAKALDDHPVAAYAVLGSSMLVSNLVLLNSRYHLSKEWHQFDENNNRPENNHFSLDRSLALNGLPPEMQATIEQQVAASHKRVSDFDRMLIAQNCIYLATIATAVTAHVTQGSLSPVISAGVLGVRNLFYSGLREAFQSVFQISRNQTATKFSVKDYPSINVHIYSGAIAACGAVIDVFFPNDGTFKEMAKRAALNALPEITDGILIFKGEQRQNPGSVIDFAPRTEINRFLGIHKSLANPGQNLPNRISTLERMRDQAGSRTFFFTSAIFTATITSKIFEMAFPVSIKAGKKARNIGNILQRWVVEPQSGTDINRKHQLLSIILSNLSVGVLLSSGFYKWIVNNWLSGAESRAALVRLAQEREVRYLDFVAQDSDSSIASNPSSVSISIEDLAALPISNNLPAEPNQLSASTVVELKSTSTMTELKPVVY